jgi:hypothetical protein
VSALSFNTRQIYLPKLHNCFTFVMLNNCNNLKTDGSLCKEHPVIIKQRLYDIAKQEFDEILHTSTKCNLYQYLVPTSSQISIHRTK